MNLAFIFHINLIGIFNIFLFLCFKVTCFNLLEFFYKNKFIFRFDDLNFNFLYHSLFFLFIFSNHLGNLFGERAYKYCVRTLRRLKDVFLYQ